MKKRYPSLFLALALALAGAPMPAAATQKLALLMANEKIQPSPEVLHATTAAFFDSKRFQIIERDQLSKIFEERDLSDFIQGTPGDLSNLRGVDLIGVVTYSQEIVPGVDGVPMQCYFINVRLTDVKSGQVTGSVTSRRTNLLNPPTTIHQSSRLLLENIREMFPPEGAVLAVTPEEIVVNLGTGDGVKVNDQLEVIQAGETYFGPDGTAYAPIEEVVGTLKVFQVGAQLSKTKAKKGAVLITVGARVRLKKTNGNGTMIETVIRTIPMIDRLRRKF